MPGLKTKRREKHRREKTKEWVHSWFMLDNKEITVMVFHRELGDMTFEEILKVRKKKLRPRNN